MKKIYSPEWDCYYNGHTLEWLESKCSDPDCQFCSVRPPKAIPDEERDEIGDKTLAEIKRIAKGK